MTLSRGSKIKHFMIGKDNPFFRIFALLYMLRDDYKFLVHNTKHQIIKAKTLGVIPKSGNKPNKLHPLEVSYKGELASLQAITNEIQRLHREAGYKHQSIIEADMTSDRIKDLHSFMDMILQVKNIDVVSQIIQEGLVDTGHQVTDFHALIQDKYEEIEELKSKMFSHFSKDEMLQGDVCAG